jgi:SAM-dependent methyltransferase
MFEKIKYFFVKFIYADHNNCKAVKSAIEDMLKMIPAEGIGLNIGAGKTNIDPRIKNLEIHDGIGIDYVGSVESIPCEGDKFDIVISQEVLEHVKNPWKAVSEIYRVLKKGGVAYIQLPFIIGFHPCPNDYWRFSKEGIEELILSSDMKIVRTEITVGGATGFYRISVEFFSILFSLIAPSTYKIFKAFFSILLYPIKFLDPLINLSKQRDRVAGGYYIICQK